jgi:hypothetical protein
MKSSEFIKENMSSGATGVGAIASISTTKNSNQVGSLFGGTYQQPTNPFLKKGRKKGSKNK